MNRDPTPIMPTASLAARQVRYQIQVTLRSPAGPFFTFVIPLMVLVALNLVYGHHSIPTRPGIGFPRFYTPAMAAFAITNACYVNLLTGVTLSREQGMLKRIRGTPLPPWIYLFGRAASAALLGLLSATAVLVVGTSMYPVAFPWHALPALALATGLGVICFCTLGLAASALVGTADAALPVRLRHPPAALLHLRRVLPHRYQPSLASATGIRPPAPPSGPQSRSTIHDCRYRTELG